MWRSQKSLFGTYPVCYWFLALDHTTPSVPDAFSLPQREQGALRVLSSSVESEHLKGERSPLASLLMNIDCWLDVGRYKGIISFCSRIPSLSLSLPSCLPTPLSPSPLFSLCSSRWLHIGESPDSASRVTKIASMCSHAWPLQLWRSFLVLF